MAATIASFRKGVLLDVPGCPEPNVDRAVRLALRDFCKRTLAWVETLTAIDIVADQALYTIAPTDDDNSLIETIKRATFDGKTITPLTREWMDGQSTTWEETEAEKATNYYLVSQTSIRLYPIPNTVLTGGLVLEVALLPTEAATEVADALYDHWHDAIWAKARATLQRQSGKPWRNATSADENEKLYNRLRGEATAQVIRNYTTIGLRARPRSFV